MNDTYVAILMNKSKLLENVFVYGPKDVIVGNYDDKNSVFTTLDGLTYYSVEDLNTFSDTVHSAFYAPLSYEKLKDTYNRDTISSDDFEQLCKIYKDDYMDSFLIVKKDKNTDAIYIQEQFLNLDDDSFFDTSSFNGDDYYDIDSTFFDDLSLDKLNELKSKYLQLKKNLDNKLNIIEQNINRMSITNTDNNCCDSNLSKEYIEQQRMYEKLFESSVYMDIPTYIKNKTGNDMFDISTISNKIKSTVVSQDEAIDRILVEVARMSLSNFKNKGILLTGSTGVGKTEILTQLAKYINRPIKIIDTTQLSSTGYVGRNIEEYLWELYIDCNRDLEKAQKAIIIFDELDKKGSERKDDISGRAVLNSMLKFMDGTSYRASENMQIERPGNYVTISTNDMLVIGSGAFSDVYKNVDKNIGFEREIIRENIEPSTDDFIEKAMMPDEFMGRFPIFVHLNDLTVQDLKKILLYSDKSPLKEQVEIFKNIGIDLIYDDQFVEKLATKAFVKKTGARGLQAVVADATYVAFKSALEYIGCYDTLLLSEETAVNSCSFQLFNSKNIPSNAMCQNKKISQVKIIKKY